MYICIIKNGTNMDINKFKQLKEENYTNQQIADIFGVSLSTLKRFIKNNNLYTKKVLDKQVFLDLYNKGLNDEDLARELNVSKSTIQKTRKHLNLVANLQKEREEKLEEFKELYKKGLNDTEISRILNVNNVTVHYWRKKYNLPSNFEYSCIVDKDLFYKFYNLGYNDKEISKELGISSSRVQEFRVKEGLDVNIYNKIIPTYEQEQVILGTLLGDGYLYKYEGSGRVRGCFAHSLKQINYCKYKEKILSNFCSKGFIKEELDKRSNKIYTCYYVNMKTSKYFTDIYPLLYSNKIKYISEEILYKLDGLGIAIWFMDDGYKTECGYCICTNCFNLNDLDKIKTFFKVKFSIDITIRKSNIIYIPAKDKDKFTNLIYPFIHDDCKYKLHMSPQTPLIQGKSNR